MPQARQKPSRAEKTTTLQARVGTLGRSDQRPHDAQSCHSLPKIVPLQGSLQPELKRCGKPTCRCARGGLHGPYWSRRWREQGQQRRCYVRNVDLEQVRASIAAWRRLHPPARSTRERLAELRRLLRQLAAGEV
jgi:hypothetical protein